MTSDIPKLLAEPFVPSAVSFRVGPTNKEKTKGMALCYIDARDVMRRLDAVCGPENWQDEYPWSDGKRVVCRIGIKIDDEWIWKTDGAGDTDEEGEKGALSDAFKRAAVKWSVGRYLYDVEARWVEIEPRGKSYIIKPSELPRLRAMLPAPRAHAPQHVAELPRGDPWGDQPPDPRPQKPVQPRPGAPPPSPANNGSGHQPPAAASGERVMDHPQREKALRAYSRIKVAIEAAATPKIIDDILKVNAADLNVIGEVHPPSRALLTKIADARKGEVLAGA